MGDNRLGFQMLKSINKSTTNKKHKLHILWSPLYVGIWILLYVIGVIIVRDLPNPIPDDGNSPGRFVAQKAEQILLKLTNLGARVVGTATNEASAVNYLIEELDQIKKNCSNDYTIETYLQTAGYGGHRVGPMMNTYRSVKNLVVKLSPKNLKNENALLINSHFDSVPQSPGGGDDGTMVAVMLEVLRVLSQSPENTITHSIIFLFNGAEEIGLQGSHAFISQHPWAQYARAFINLDSAGNGGKEILFQSGPNHPWLMKYYKQSALHPLATTLAEEMFQRGLIPSDTDFRIFRDHGRIPGLDFAHAYNGYVYHTKYDRFSSIPAGTLQHTGDNILELAKALANAPELDNPKEHAEGHTVFYDFLGLFIITYTEHWSFIINICIAMIAVTIICISLWFIAKSSKLSLLKVMIYFAISIFIQVLALVIGCGIPFGLALIFGSTGKVMWWFSQPWLIFGIYMCPLLFGLGIVPAIYFSLSRNNILLLSHRIQLILHAHCVFLILMLLACTAHSIRSGYIFMIAVSFYTFTTGINLVTTFHKRAFLWLIPHLIGQVIPFIYYSYNTQLFLSTFIPMSGRAGNGSNPEVIICVITLVFGLLMSGFLAPILCIFRQSKTIISGFLAVTVIFLIIIFTPIGFPFRADSTPERYFVGNLKATLKDFDGSTRKTETGFVLHPLDQLSPYSVKNHVINMSLVQTFDTNCPPDLHCGFSSYVKADANYWIPGEEPKAFPFVNVRIISKETLSNNITRFRMEVDGPDRMYFVITPADNETELVSWSFPVRFNKNEWTSPYLIYFSNGEVNPEPLEISLDFKVPRGWSGQTFGLGVSALWTHHTDLYTEKFEKFLSSFPDWTFVNHWVEHYESWEF